jgi:hypothetical protein
LEDGVSILISWAMIFTMLIYVCPLNIIFGGMFYGLSDAVSGNPSAFIPLQKVALFSRFTAWASPPSRSRSRSFTGVHGNCARLCD